MLTMSQINHIKDLSNCGYRISEISKKTGADPKTIRKYLAQDDFSPQPPVIQEKPSKLDPFKPIIQEWLDEDKKLLWSSFFVTLVAKKYRLATMLPFEPRMVCDSR